MIHLGLIGFPLGHTLSPRIHSAALRACNLDGDYSLFPIVPDDIDGLKALLDRVRTGEIQGLNVTIPHKQNVIPLLDGLTETAKTIGAVNTISLQNGQLIGDNTDAPGFLSDLNKFLNKSSRVTRHASLVLGAGGSARAVVYALCNAGWQVTIAARCRERAQELTRIACSQVGTIEYGQFELQRPDLVVNTTPLGMKPDVETSPWPDGAPFPDGAAVYDLVYNPPETRFVREARAAGLPAITGLGMLIEQAALAFEIWTGCSPQRETLWQTVDD
jgi:shikimate dehydrogenase